jgi:integrase
MGRQIRRTIGTTDSHKLSEARDEARKIIADAAKGMDTASREARRAAARAAQVAAERASADSFRSCVEGYLNDPGRRGGAKMKSRTLVEQRLENHAMPRFGDRPIGEIARSEIKDLLRDLVKAGKPTAANRLLGNLKLVFKWAVEGDKIESSPIVDLERPADESSRDRVLTDAELVEIWRGCEGLSRAHAGAIRLMLLTGARRSEAGGLRRSELADGVWNLPAARSKNGRPHIVPLSDLVRQIVEGVPQIEGADLVFTLDGETAINGWSKIKARLDKVIGQARAAASGETYESEKHDLSPHWTFHDLRRTLVTGMIESLGIAPHVVEAVVNHVSGQSRAGVAGVYNRSVLLPQRREALQAWSQHIAGLVAGATPAANVARLTRRAG